MLETIEVEALVTRGLGRIVVMNVVAARTETIAPKTT
jgi:hypothetical protein